MLPDFEMVFRRLPDAIGREAVRRFGTAACRGPVDARRAFVATMTWGYADRGYGPWRTARILRTNPGAADQLLQVAREVRDHGALAAYDLMAGRCRLRGLGPAFGTKYLYFCSTGAATERALIMDRLVADWLASHASLHLNPVPWSSRTYRRYLDLLREWARELRRTPEELECCIFRDEARRRGSGQWGS